jgi:hypothetical protein
MFSSRMVCGFAIGTGEFAIMGLLPDVARTFAVTTPQAGYVIGANALGCYYLDCGSPHRIQNQKRRKFLGTNPTKEHHATQHFIQRVRFYLQYPQGSRRGDPVP